MPFKGTKKWPTAQAVNQVIDSIGGFLTPLPIRKKPVFGESGPETFRNGIRIFIPVNVSSSTASRGAGAGAGVILEEIKMRDDDPMIKVGDSFETQIFPGRLWGRR